MSAALRPLLDMEVRIMTITTRARVALFVAIATLLIAAFAGGSRLASADSEDVGGGSQPSTGGSARACVAPEPGVDVDCDDTIGAPPTGPEIPCGEQVSGTGPDASVSYTPCPGDGTDVPPVDGGAQVVEPRPGMADVRPHIFDEAVVSDDGRSVEIFFWSGVEPCYVLDHVDVDYGDTAITITLFEGHDPSAGDVACIEIAMLKETVVRLDQPVGDRVIVDGAA